jgi:uncharacterized protein YaaQ
LGFSTQTRGEEAFKRQQARARAAQASYEHLRSMREEGLISDYAWQILEPPMKHQIEVRTDAVHRIMQADRSLETAELNNAFREGLRAQRDTYNDLLNSGAISEEIFTRLVNEVDTALIYGDISPSDLVLRRAIDAPPITKLICAMVSENDIQETLSRMVVMGIPITPLSSFRGEDKTPYITLLLAVEEEQVEEVIQAVLDCCQDVPVFRRGIFDFLPESPGGEVQIEGMDVYVMDIEHYEEI